MVPEYGKGKKQRYTRLSKHLPRDGRGGSIAPAGATGYLTSWLSEGGVCGRLACELIQ
jgi:hypothetical protein